MVRIQMKESLVYLGKNYQKHETYVVSQDIAQKLMGMGSAYVVEFENSANATIEAGSGVSIVTDGTKTTIINDGVTSIGTVFNAEKWVGDVILSAENINTKDGESIQDKLDELPTNIVTDVEVGRGLQVDKSNPQVPKIQAIAGTTSSVNAGRGISAVTSVQGITTINNTGVLQVQGGEGVTIDNADPNNPIINVTIDTSGNGTITGIHAGENIVVSGTSTDVTIGAPDLVPRFIEQQVEQPDGALHTMFNSVDYGSGGAKVELISRDHTMNTNASVKVGLDETGKKGMNITSLFESSQTGEDIGIVISDGSGTDAQKGTFLVQPNGLYEAKDQIATIGSVEDKVGEAIADIDTGVLTITSSTPSTLTVDSSDPHNVKLSGLVTPAVTDNSTIAYNADNELAVKISADTSNGLTVKSDGLYVAPSAPVRDVRITRSTLIDSVELYKDDTGFGPDTVTEVKGISEYSLIEVVNINLANDESAGYIIDIRDTTKSFVVRDTGTSIHFTVDGDNISFTTNSASFVVNEIRGLELKNPPNPIIFEETATTIADSTFNLHVSNDLDITNTDIDKFEEFLVEVEMINPSNQDEWINGIGLWTKDSQFVIINMTQTNNQTAVLKMAMNLNTEGILHVGFGTVNNSDTAIADNVYRIKRIKSLEGSYKIDTSTTVTTNNFIGDGNYNGVELYKNTTGFGIDTETTVDNISAYKTLEVVMRAGTHFETFLLNKDFPSVYFNGVDYTFTFADTDKITYTGTEADASVIESIRGVETSQKLNADIIPAYVPTVANEDYWLQPNKVIDLSATDIMKFKYVNLTLAYPVDNSSGDNAYKPQTVMIDTEQAEGEFSLVGLNSGTSETYPTRSIYVVRYTLEEGIMTIKNIVLSYTSQTNSSNTSWSVGATNTIMYRIISATGVGQFSYVKEIQETVVTEHFEKNTLIAGIVLYQNDTGFGVGVTQHVENLSKYGMIEVVVNNVGPVILDTTLNSNSVTVNSSLMTFTFDGDNISFKSDNTSRVVNRIKGLEMKTPPNPVIYEDYSSDFTNAPLLCGKANTIDLSGTDVDKFSSFIVSIGAIDSTQNILVERSSFLWEYNEFNNVAGGVCRGINGTTFAITANMDLDANKLLTVSAWGTDIEGTATLSNGYKIISIKALEGSNIIDNSTKVHLGGSQLISGIELYNDATGFGINTPTTIAGISQYGMIDVMTASGISWILDCRTGVAIAGLGADDARYTLTITGDSVTMTSNVSNSGTRVTAIRGLELKTPPNPVIFDDMNADMDNAPLNVSKANTVDISTTDWDKFHTYVITLVSSHEEGVWQACSKMLFQPDTDIYVSSVVKTSNTNPVGIQIPFTIKNGTITTDIGYFYASGGGTPSASVYKIGRIEALQGSYVIDQSPKVYETTTQIFNGGGLLRGIELYNNDSGVVIPTSGVDIEIPNIGDYRLVEVEANVPSGPSLTQILDLSSGSASYRQPVTADTNRVFILTVSDSNTIHAVASASTCTLYKVRGLERMEQPNALIFEDMTDNFTDAPLMVGQANTVDLSGTDVDKFNLVEVAFATQDTNSSNGYYIGGRVLINLLEDNFMALIYKHTPDEDIIPRQIEIPFTFDPATKILTTKIGYIQGFQNTTVVSQAMVNTTKIVSIKALEGSQVINTGTQTGGGQVDSVVAGTGITVDNTDPANPIINATSEGTVKSVVAGTNVTVDSTDTANPVINVADSVASVTAGSNITVDNTDPKNPVISGQPAGVQTVVAGTGLTIDNTDPANPVINAEVTTGGVTKTLIHSNTSPQLLFAKGADMRTTTNIFTGGNFNFDSFDAYIFELVGHDIYSLSGQRSINLVNFDGYFTHLTNGMWGGVTPLRLMFRASGSYMTMSDYAEMSNPITQGHNIYLNILLGTQGSGSNSIDNGNKQCYVTGYAEDWVYNSGDTIPVTTLRGTAPCDIYVKNVYGIKYSNPATMIADINDTTFTQMTPTKDN